MGFIQSLIDGYKRKKQERGLCAKQEDCDFFLLGIAIGTSIIQNK